MNKVKSVSYELTYVLLDYAKSIGLGLNKIYNTADFNSDILNNKSARIPLGDYLEIWDLIVEKSDDKYFGLHFSRVTQGCFGGHVLCAVMMNSPNVGEALNRFIRYYKLLSDIITPIVEGKNGLTHLSWKFNHTFKIDDHLSHSLLIMFQSILQCLGTTNIKETRFIHSPPVELTKYQNIFKGRLHFNQKEYAIVIDREELFNPVTLSNPQLLEFNERIAEKLLEKISSTNLWTNKVATIINRQLLNYHTLDIKSISEELAVSTRNLQLHLKEEGTSYKSLSDKIKKEAALSFMEESSVSLYDITFYLGFAEQSSFNRAFKRWTGTNPNEYRKTLNHNF